MDRGKMTPVTRRSATMTTQDDLRHPLKSGVEERGGMVKKSYPQDIKLLPLDPLLPWGFAPRNAELRLSSAKGSAPLGSPKKKDPLQWCER